MLFTLKDIPLPKNWTSNIKTSILHIISLAYLSISYARGWAENCLNIRIKLSAKLDRALNEIELLKDEIRIKDARTNKIHPNNRPHYPPTERLAILELKASHGWSQAQTAQRFLVKPSTIAYWLKRIDTDTLVQTRTPVNKFPDFVKYIVIRLKTLCPTLGKRKIAQILFRPMKNQGLNQGKTDPSNLNALHHKLR